MHLPRVGCIRSKVSKGLTLLQPLWDTSCGAFQSVFAQSLQPRRLQLKWQHVFAIIPMPPRRGPRKYLSQHHLNQKLFTFKKVAKVSISSRTSSTPLGTISGQYYDLGPWTHTVLRLLALSLINLLLSYFSTRASRSTTMSNSSLQGLTSEIMSIRL